MTLKARFNVFWDRLSRSTPLIGIAASLFFMPARLKRESDEDAAYRALMKEVGSEPRFPSHSVECEKEVIVGEVLGHFIALVAAYPVWRVYPVAFHVFLGTWALAFFLDYLGGKIATWNFNRRQPSIEEIVDSVVDSLMDPEGKAKKNG